MCQKFLHSFKFKTASSFFICRPRGEKWIILYYKKSHSDSNLMPIPVLDTIFFVFYISFLSILASNKLDHGFHIFCLKIKIEPDVFAKNMFVSYHVINKIHNYLIVSLIYNYLMYINIWNLTGKYFNNDEFKIILKKYFYFQ